MSGPCPIPAGMSEDIPFIYSDPPNSLAANAVSSVLVPIHSALDNLTTAPFAFTRTEGIPNEPLISNYPIVSGPTPPDRLPSVLPPPGNLSLSIRFGAYLGYGRCGVVFEAEVDLQNSSHEVGALAIPPLVAKVSRSGHSIDLRREAFYYDEMECLQGCVIPRYYGLFQGVLPAGSSLLSPSEDQTIRDLVQVFAEDSSGSSDEIFSHEEREMRRNDTSVCILIMEHLGGKLPIGQKLDNATTPEVLDLYEHLANLGVDHVDIRHANILYALESPPGWPSRVCPFSRSVYHYRLIDFERARKTNWSIADWHAYHEDWVERLLEGLPLGYVLEMSDF